MCVCVCIHSEKTEEKEERGIEKIEHKTISVNGINKHIAEKGKGSVVLFLYGFPELWYSWQHQILYTTTYSYRAVALDL
ncbi:hypothetical protein ACSBR2_002943 [Camellia fascicularis]